jgi:hypothetical protein
MPASGRYLVDVTACNHARESFAAATNRTSMLLGMIKHGTTITITIIPVAADGQLGRVGTARYRA